MQAQQAGKPFVYNYPAKNYKAAIQNWAIVQDKRGVLYFANDQGVLEYDGKNWQLIKTANNSAVRSLAIDAQGVIYVGGSGEFGYLSPDDAGKLQYISLVNLLPTKDQKFEDVYSTHASEKGVYFHTDNIIFKYDPQSNKIQTWYANPDSFFFLTFLVNGNLFVHDLKTGLMQLKNNQIKLVKGGEKFIGERIYMMLPYNDSRILLGTRNKGLFIYQPNEEPEKIFQPFETKADEFILKNQLYSGTRLPDGTFALCTRTGGLIIIDVLGYVQNIITKKEGLSDENIRYAFQSKDNTLWLALDNGISQVNLESPIRFWDESMGIKGTIRDIILFEDEIYVATSLGIFYLEQNKFAQVQDISTDCWTLLNFNIVTKDGQENQLLVGTNAGIYQIKNKKANLIKQTNNLAVLKLYQSNRTQRKIYAGLKGGLLTMHYEFGEWFDEGLIENIKDEIYSIAEDKDGSIWLGTFIQGILSCKINETKRLAFIKKYDTNAGLPTMRDNKAYRIGNRVLFATQRGLYRFDTSKNIFTKDSLLGNDFVNSERGIYRIAFDRENNIWTTDINTQKYPIGVGLRQQDGLYRWYDIPLRRLPEFSEPVIYPDKQGYVWIGGSEGLFRYDTHKKQRLNQPFYTLIRSVILGEDKIIFNGSFYTPQTDKLKNNVVSTTQTQQLQFVFPFNPQFLIQFQFATPYFDNEFANEYSHFLKGYDKTWSSWSKDNKTQYNSLFEGKYTFYVKARNIYGKESIVSTYSFSITPPWYRLLGVRFIFILLILLLIWWGIRLYTQNLVRQKTRLEQIVAARTQEISLKNVELEKQKEAISIQSHEIEKKNEDITASISYASRIQRAMLPRLEQIQEAFPDSFVWLQPKDIVSGDFYWFTETPLEPRFFKDPNIQNGKVSIFKGFGGGKKIIAAVDCTGHGIPGAFVSMMGDAYLNQIVNLENVSQAHLILKELHEYVRHALKQDDGENLDGMDMALCVIDPTNRDLEYAGAKNPLIYIQDNEIFIIKGDKYGIGGFQFEQGEKDFTRHTILLDKPTSFYLLSDGFEDQFGGEKGKKFSIKRIKELLLEHWQKPMSEQKEIYQQAFETWKEDYPQIDDVLLLGVHINPSDFDI